MLQIREIGAAYAELPTRQGWLPANVNRASFVIDRRPGFGGGPYGTKAAPLLWVDHVFQRPGPRRDGRRRADRTKRREPRFLRRVSSEGYNLLAFEGRERSLTPYGN